MSHTTEIKMDDYNGGTAVFIHDGDFYGPVVIRHNRKEFTIPFIALRDFVAEHVRHEKIKEFEKASADKLLGNGFDK